MLDQLYETLTSKFRNVWFLDHGFTVHFGPDRKVTVELVGPMELRLAGPGYLLMDVEELLEGQWKIT